jgi:hypothetical protein
MFKVMLLSAVPALMLMLMMSAKHKDKPVENYERVAVREHLQQIRSIATHYQREMPEQCYREIMFHVQIGEDIMHL